MCLSFPCQILFFSSVNVSIISLSYSSSQVGSLFFGTRASTIAGEEGRGGAEATPGSHTQTRVFVIPRRGAGGWGDERGRGCTAGAEERAGKGQEEAMEGSSEASSHLRMREGEGSGTRGRKGKREEDGGSCAAAQLRKPVVMALEGFGTASGAL